MIFLYTPNIFDTNIDVSFYISTDCSIVGGVWERLFITYLRKAMGRSRPNTWWMVSIRITQITLV